MQKKPLVSILIPTTITHYIFKKCINSLNSQTYKNLEIIFFDDNSYNSRNH